MTGPAPHSHPPSQTALGSVSKGNHMSIYEYLKLLEYAHKLEEENERLRQCVMVHEAALVSLWAHARGGSVS